MYDSFNRHIHYLRISVTDKCNLRCRYCMPAEGIPLIHHQDILRLEEIFEVARYGVEMGIDKVRITGGEPLVRKGIVDLVAMLSTLKGIKDLSMTTNGILLSQYAHALASAGLQRVNISLDSVDPERYREITRLGRLESVFEGIQAARQAGLWPIKLNCVVRHDSSEEDATGVRAFAESNGLEVRFIRQMDLLAGTFSVVENGEGGHCEACSRLRLTSDGWLKPCLFNDLGYSIRAHGIPEAYALAIANKPACGTHNHHGSFFRIGG